MKKTLLSAAGAFVIAAFALSGAAQAQCFWTGFGYSCAAPAMPSYYPDPYWYWYGSTYPAYNQPDGGWGYKPNWYPSMLGPRTSAGAGH